MIQKTWEGLEKAVGSFNFEFAVAVVTKPEGHCVAVDHSLPYRRSPVKSVGPRPGIDAARISCNTERRDAKSGGRGS